MTIEENLILLQNTKEAIYTAIESMGGTISSSTPFSGYADAIMSIPQSEQDPCVEDPYGSQECSECWEEGSGFPSGLQGIGLHMGEQVRVYFPPFQPNSSERYQIRTIRALSNCDCGDSQEDSSWQVEYDAKDGMAGVSAGQSGNLTYVAGSVFNGVFDDVDTENMLDGYIDLEASADGWYYFCTDGVDISNVEKIDGGGE